MAVLDPTTALEALNALNAQVAVLDGDGRIELVNDAWRHFPARSGAHANVADWTGMDYLAVCRTSIGPDGGEGPVAATGIAAVISGNRREFRLEYPCDTPLRKQWFELHVTARNPERPRAGAVIAHFDVTERKEAELERNRLLAVEQVERRRASFLADSMEILERSLVTEVVSAGLAQLCCTALADLAIVDLLDDRRMLRRVSVAVADPDDAGLAEELKRATSFGGPPGHPVREALRHRMPVSGAVNAELLVDAFVPEHAAVVAGLGVRSYLTVPLHGRVGLLGTLTVASRGSRAYAGGMDRDAIEDLARCASLALDNARLHSELQQTARVLQDGLRPAELPEIDGIDVAAAWRPAGETLLVGGDFYDMVSLGASNWGLTLGDVSGKGAQAATITSLTRHTARAAAVFGATPSGVLRALDDALVGDGEPAFEDHFCTAIHAQIVTHDYGVSLDVAGAGHVPPVVVRAGGAAEIVECGGTLLGVLETARIGEVQVHLEPGDAIVFYTDGVLDAQAPQRQLFGEDVAAALSEHAGSSARALVAAVEALALEPAGTSQRDDIAVVALVVT